MSYPNHPRQSAQGSAGVPPQPGPDDQPHPQAQSHASEGQGQVIIDIKHHPLMFTFTRKTPQITINGHQQPGQWGHNVLPLPPGQHHLRVHLPYFLPPKYGPADLTMPMAAGQTVRLEYRAPMAVFSPGSFGPPPQRWNGLTASLIVIAVVIAPIQLLFYLLLLSVLVGT
jgi:hypothetical protein